MIYVNWLIWYMVYTNALLSSPAHIQAAPDLVSTPNNNLDTPFSFAAARWQLWQKRQEAGAGGGVAAGDGAMASRDVVLCVHAS